MALPSPIQLLPGDLGSPVSPCRVPPAFFGQQRSGEPGAQRVVASVGSHLTPHAPMPLHALVFICISDLLMSCSLC